MAEKPREYLKAAGAWTASECHVLLVDDHPLFLEAVGLLLERLGFALVGKAESATEALRFLEEHAVDVVLLDLQLPDMDGLTCLREIRRTHPETIVIVLSGVGDEADFSAALEEGAAAGVEKSADPEDVATAIRQVFRRSVYLASAGRPASIVADARRSKLTAREFEILCLLAEGGSNAEIARQLWITEQTVKFHLSNVYRKLGVSNRTAASYHAHRLGLLAEDAGSLGA